MLIMDFSVGFGLVIQTHTIDCFPRKEYPYGLETAVVELPLKKPQALCPILAFTNCPDCISSFLDTKIERNDFVLLKRRLCGRLISRYHCFGIVGHKMWEKRNVKFRDSEFPNSNCITI